MELPITIRPSTRDDWRVSPSHAWDVVELPHIPGTPMGWVITTNNGLVGTDIDGKHVGPPRLTTELAALDVAHHLGVW